MINNNSVTSKKISVVVPVYNVQDYLKKCVDSLLNQTMDDELFEIILVDDGSTDNSGQICDDYQVNSNNVKVLHKSNGGLSDARNFGLSYAIGEYVLFIDSDDYVENKMLEKMYELSSDGTKKIIECNFFWDFKTKSKQDFQKKYKSIRDYLINGRVVAWNKLYLREWIQKTGIKFPVGKLYEDQCFFFKMVTWLDNIDEVAIDTTCEVHYVQREDSISYNETKRIAEIAWIYEDILNYYEDRQVLTKFHDELEYRFYRNLFGNVLLRKVLRVKAKKVRNELLNLIWIKVELWFPKRKNNPYLKKVSASNLYLCLMNKAFYALLYLI